MAGQLTGKVALVTGGSRGIGAAIAARLASEGADVVVTARQGRGQARAVVADIEKTGRRGLALASDSANPAAAASAVKQTVDAFGRLDILVNNAGIAIAKPLADYTLEDYDQTMAINTRRRSSRRRRRRRTWARADASSTSAAVSRNRSTARASRYAR